MLLPVYAGDSPEHFLRAVLSATVEQTLPPSELVVVRDGQVGAEVAAVLDALRSGPQTSPAGEVPVRVVELEQNQGLARALDVGLDACRYDIVARADADDISLPHRFEIQLPLIAAGLDIVGSAITEFNSDEHDLGITRVLPEQADDIARTARFRDPFNHPSVVYRREAVIRAGGYKHLDLLEDYWLFARMLAGGARAANVRSSLVLYRVGAGAYKRRGGLRLLRSEVRLQLLMRKSGFTTTFQLARNLLVRGGYRLVPEAVRRPLYRRMIRPPTDNFGDNQPNTG